MTASLCAPMDMIGNIFNNIILDPQAGRLSPLAAGVTMDTFKNLPINVFSNIPYFESEAENSEPANLPVGGPAG